jgi:hypothetical protein
MLSAAMLGRLTVAILVFCLVLGLSAVSHSQDTGSTSGPISAWSGSCRLPPGPTGTCAAGSTTPGT